MRLRKLLTSLVVVVALVQGCGGGAGSVLKTGGVAISQAAVREGAGLVGGVSKTVEASADDVGRLSAEAAVSEDVLRTVAPQLDQQTVWQRSVTSARRAYARVPDEVREPVTSLACQIATGQITTKDDFYAAATKELDVLNMTRSEIEAAISDIDDLYQDLVAARSSPDPEQRASAVLFCFTVEQVQG